MTEIFRGHDIFYLVHYTKSALPRMRICELECCSIICSERTLSSLLSVHAATKHAHGIEPTTFKNLASIQSLMIHAVKRSTARHEHHAGDCGARENWKSECCAAGSTRLADQLPSLQQRVLQDSGRPLDMQSNQLSPFKQQAKLTKIIDR